MGVGTLRAAAGRREGGWSLLRAAEAVGLGLGTANLRTSTKIVDFRGFDSIIILLSRGGILMSTGNAPESLSEAILAGIVNVLGV